MGADWATAMIVEVKTGRIMAGADWPTVDPNDLDAVGDEDRGARIFSSPFEPGSVMKVATFASLLDQGKITPDDAAHGARHLHRGAARGRSIKDSWAHGDMRLTATGILVNSSNIGTAILAQKLSKQVRHDYLEAFGFNSDTAVDFLGESSGSVLPMDQTDAITNLTQQFGQGMSATSAQIASLYQTIGNGGVRMPLTLIDGCEWPDGTWTQKPSDRGRRASSASPPPTPRCR